ncbi:MAG: hypothetical protein M3295_04560 [Chloroflexota bacterium]|nr:hypothetical protein [Chloroflexota bacterium]
MNRWVRAGAFSLGAFVSYSYLQPTGVAAVLGVLGGVLVAILAADAFARVSLEHRAIVLRSGLRLLVFGATFALLYAYLSPTTPTSLSAVLVAALVTMLFLDRSIGTRARQTA